MKTLRELLEEAGDVSIRFWVCPIDEHRERRNVVTVEWVNGVAHCTHPGCKEHS